MLDVKKNYLSYDLPPSGRRIRTEKKRENKKGGSMRKGDRGHKRGKDGYGDSGTRAVPKG